ncbi:MAG TPA: hypothetical protein VFB62_01700 [Polyangiaceae bacterium]|nr:hypothetical protein [Polyangiaceae bacterium]
MTAEQLRARAIWLMAAMEEADLRRVVDVAEGKRRRKASQEPPPTITADDIEEINDRLREELARYSDMTRREATTLLAQLAEYYSLLPTKRDTRRRKVWPPGTLGVPEPRP